MKNKTLSELEAKFKIIDAKRTELLGQIMKIKLQERNDNRRKHKLEMLNDLEEKVK